MLISTWLTAVRDRLQTSRVVKRRPNQRAAAQAAENLEIRALLTTTLNAVRPNVGEFLTPGEIRHVAPQELTLQFSLGSTITAASITNQSIRCFTPGSDGVFGNANDIPVSIGYVGAGSVPNEVVLRFGENLIDEKYRIVVNGTGSNALAATVVTTTGVVVDPVANATFDFELDLGARIIAVDPQPVTRAADGTLSQARNRIVLYFSDDTLNEASAENPNFYQLIKTNETVSSLDDGPENPTSVVYNATQNTATLTFASTSALLSGAGSYRLRVGNAETLPIAPALLDPALLPTPVEPGSSFPTALSLPPVNGSTNSSTIISSSIAPQFVAFQFPGAGDEPGHREIEVENHLNGGADTASSGIPFSSYNFKTVYGTDPQGNVLNNAITDAQKDRAREIFAYYSEKSGIDFRETAASGLTVVTGDMRALDPTIPTGPGGVAGLAGGGMAIMDMAETWGNLPGENWFNVAMHEIGHLLGQGHTYDLPDPTVQGSGTSGSTGTGLEPTLLGDHDIVHMQHMYRPDSVDIDLYRFQTTATSIFSAEIMAERMANSSTLDSVLRLYRQIGGRRELVAQNDNYFSKDSFLELTLEPGTYFIGVSSTGNDAYDPTIQNTGMGGTSQGAYDLRVNFRPNVAGFGSAIVDTTGRTFDGDSDGIHGGVYNFWFNTASAANTLFVDKAEASFLRTAITASATSIGVERAAAFALTAIIRINNEQMRITAINLTTNTLTVTRAQNGTSASSHSVDAPIRKISSNGALSTPFGFINDAIAIATPGQIVRIVGNAGADNNSATLEDSFPYEIGVNTAGQALWDGAALEAPRGVTVMIDKGAVVKLRRGWIGTGSSTTSVDRSGSAVQVLGTPNRQVIMTSWNDETIGTDTTLTPTAADEGDWGGIIFRNEIDRAQNRYNSENEGIFLNYVGFATLLWGGGTVTIDSTTQTINPIHMDRSQPTIVNNTIQSSDDSAMSADPDSFEELTFHSPRFQTGKTAFTVDYKRIGPDIYGNKLLNNGNNALFVRMDTVAGGGTQKLTVPGRFNDTDIVHLVAQNLEIQGTPGGAFQETVAPSVTLVTLTTVTGGTLAVGAYRYRVVFTDENGFESPASATTGLITRATAGSVRLGQLPQVSSSSIYVGRRIYRSDSTGGGTFTLIADLDKSATVYIDNGVTKQRTLPASPTGARDRARLDARLSIDPGIIVKLQGARIEAEMGAQLIAEGVAGRQVIFTSRLDDRYGAGGTFDTNNDDSALAAERVPSAGNWAGLYIGHLGSGSIDRALVTFAGGNVPVGGSFAAFNPVEIHEAKVRIRNTTFETNANGASSGIRSGLFSNDIGTIFVRGAQPVLLDNTFVGNAGPIININVNALNKDFVADPGRSTGFADLQQSYGDNQGPLIRDNVLQGNGLNGMVVRGETITTQSIWDDTDVVHIVQSEIYLPNLHTYGGVRLESSSTESLVVKLSGPTAGFTAGGSTLDITDRIGGMLHLVGQPGQPVILTSLTDDTAGAGYNLQGLLQKDTNGNGASVGAPGAWRGVRIERYSHDRNVAVYVENEIADRQSSDTNSVPAEAETIGSLAENEKWGDENLRLGIDLQGFIDSPGDVDVYSFSGVAGSQIWIDIDRTTHGLDSVVELIDSNGVILAQSDNYYNEKLGTWSVVSSAADNILANGLDYSQFLSDDHYSTNALDAGLRVVLPGTDGVRSRYWVRVRSSNIDSATGASRVNLQNSNDVGKGLTSGVYQLQIRLRELDEFAGTTVQYTDIRFATTGIDIVGQPIHGPLTGESEEVEGTTGQLGNLMDSDRAALAVRGRINSLNDVDFYQFEVNYTHTQQIPGVGLTSTHIPVVFDLDYADGLARADMSMAIYDSTGRLILIGRDSNITDDQSGPQEGTDTDDLTRGSVGTFDPFIGAVELPGGRYSLAVFNNRQMPAVLDQFFTANSNSPLLRVEPVNSVRRIFEERFSLADNDLFTSATNPVTNLFNVGAGGQLAAKHAVPYHLGDVVLFVSQSGGQKGNDQTTIRTLNPFTGEISTTLGSFGPSVGDIAMRPDGQLYGFSTVPQGGGESTAGVTGNYLRIDTGTAGASVIGDDGLVANRDSLDANGVSTADNNVTASNAGMLYRAMTYTGTGDNNLYAVGNRSSVTEPGASSPVAAYDTNVLYRFNTRSGAVDGVQPDRINKARAFDGAGTTQREIGRIIVPGNVTGMTFAGGVTYVVNDLGNLYSVNLGTAAATPIGAATVGGQGYAFTSLVAAPAGVENGAYSNVLFAMTNTGRLVAFYRSSGALAPVFFDGQSSVQTTLGGSTTGLAFSTLTRNLWATTTNRGDDAGHGVGTRFDDSVLSSSQAGGQSLYFGNQAGGASQGNQNNLDGAILRNVDFPGGAQGSVVSNEFSLQGYSGKDKPVLYFNYFLQTENANYNPNTDATTLMRDSFRVFIADESGRWNLVSTNDSFKSSGLFIDDEFDYGGYSPAINGQALTKAPQGQTFPDVVEAFDNTPTWRQARIDLSNFAGRTNLKLRFDFSTAGSMGVGSTFQTGSELRAVPGSRLVDGDIFTIDGVSFEFNMGSTLSMPSRAVALGKSFTVDGQTFTFSAVAGGANTIVVLATDTPATVAAKAAARVNAVLGGVAALLPSGISSNRVTFPGRTVTLASPELALTGSAALTPGNRPVVVTPAMTANDVALVIRQAIADQFSAGDISNVKGSEELIWIIGHTVSASGPLGFEDSLPGDTFGAFTTGFLEGRANRGGSLRGMNNAVEGVYVDDIVLGFAERGEMVINAAASNGFVANKDIIDAYPAGNVYLGIDLGAYDVEIRRTSDYALTEDASPTNSLYDAIDTNGRLANVVSVTVPNSWSIVDGSTITISDGINQVIFEFNDILSPGTSTPGSYPIPYSPSTGETSGSLAFKLRTAINSAEVQSLLKIKASLSDGTHTGSGSTSNILHLTGNARVTVSVDIAASVIVTAFNRFGDQNHHRDQGQLIIRESSITDSSQFGIVADAAQRGANGDIPGPGSVRNLHTINDEGLVPGVVIMNNVIAANRLGGIRFSGDQAGGPAGPVPYGRIVNNTIVGLNGGTGILVEQRASPTVLNNIIADFATGISIDGSSQAAGTTIGSTLYRGNTVNSNAGLGAFPISLLAGQPLFVDQANRNYYPAPNSRAIDSSLTSLGDRDAILRIKQPLDLDGRDDKGSPIIAPEFDLYGQLRGNDPDVETPAGQGASVLFDRGAIDRVDFAGPQAQLSNPEDQSLLDFDSDIDEVWIDQAQILRQFRVRLYDEGIGIDHRTVDKSQFVLKRVLTDGITEVLLVEGVDYQFSYNEVTREAILTAATFFADENTEVRYILTVDNDGISAGDTVDGPRDLAGNYLLANKANGTTRFDIVLTDGVNDPPEITAPLNATTDEDTALVFNGTQAISIFDQDSHLGTNILTVTLTAANGRMTLGTIPAGLDVTVGDGTLDGTMTFTGKLQDLNAALNGLRFNPTANFFGTATVTIEVDDLGEFSGLSAVSTHDISIDVTPVNDNPTFNPITDQTVDEDAVASPGFVTIPGFITGMSAGPANESTQVLSTRVTIVSENSAWTDLTFFSSAPEIVPTADPTVRDLRFRTRPDVNGEVTIRVEVLDNAGGVSARTFTLTVLALNDRPVYIVDPSLVTPIVSSEDQSLVNINVPLILRSGAGPDTALDELNSQTLTWVLVNFTRDVAFGNLEFDVLQVQPNGVLEYRPRLHTFGSGVITLQLLDSGSNAPPGNFNSANFLTIPIRITEVNDGPVARTPNYVVDEGYSITLDARLSTDVDELTVPDTQYYSWDLNDDGMFETDAGTSPTLTVTWAQLVALGIDAPSLNTIKLKVTDSGRSGALVTSGRSVASDPLSSIHTATLRTLIVDYGDAPNSYGTLQSSNGAAHTISNSLFLGTRPDSEITGVPGTSATGDNANGVNDEDGVKFPVTIEAAPAAGDNLPSYVDVTASRAGKLDIWLDLNGNGVFNHASEHLNGGVSYSVVAGVNRIFFNVPAGSVAGPSMMRFRVSTAGLLLPTGRATNGEVEDYAVEILTPQQAVTPVITRPIDFNLADGLRPVTTDSTPTIKWTMNAKSYTYDVIVTNSNNNQVFRITDLQVDSATVSTSLPAGIYTATVVARNKSGAAAPLANYEFEVAKLVVSSPSGDIRTSRPTITWNHVPGSSTYTVQINSLTTGVTVLTRTFAAGTTDPATFVVPNNLALGRYQVRIRATDDANLAGDWGPYKAFRVRTAPVINGPASVVTNTARPTISWTAVTGATNYTLVLFNLTDNVAVQTVTGIPTTSWVSTTDLPVGRFRIVVTAFNSANESSFASTTRIFRLAPIPTVVNPFGRLDDATPTFAWNSVLGADLYELIVRRDFGNFGIVYQQKTLPGNVTQHTMPTPLPLGRYTYEVRALNKAALAAEPDAYSSRSLVTTFTVAESPVITGPPSSTFLARPAFTWNNPPLSNAAAQSDIRVSIKEGADFRVVLNQRVTGMSFTPSADLAIGAYKVEVRTYSTLDPGQVSEWSVARNFRVTTAPVIIGPSGRTADATPSLNWSGVLGGQTYQVIVTSLSKNVVAYNVTGINALNYTIPFDLPIGRYRFAVQARTAFGELSDLSLPKDFQIVAAPTVTGPSSSTFNRTPSFAWNDMSGIVGGVMGGATSYDFALDFIPAAGQADVAYPVITGLRNTDYTVTRTLPLGLYRATVRARSADVIGDFSTVLEFYVGGIPVVNAIGTTTDRTPTISWRPVDGASGYNIFIALDSSPDVAVAQQSGIGSTSYTAPFVLAKGTYRVWIQAVNGANGQLSGPALSGDPSIVFTIADASDVQKNDRTQNYTVTSVPMDLFGMVSESTISMLPSVIFGSPHVEMVIADQAVDAELQISSEGVVETAEANAEAVTETIPQTDEILARWDEQKWWDAVPAALAPVVTAPAVSPVKVEEKPEELSASAGLLGAIMALAPWALRRRRKDDSST